MQKFRCQRARSVDSHRDTSILYFITACICFGRFKKIFAIIDMGMNHAHLLVSQLCKCMVGSMGINMLLNALSFGISLVKADHV